MQSAGTFSPRHSSVSATPSGRASTQTSAAADGVAKPPQRLDDARPATPSASGWWGGRSCFACCAPRTSTPYQDTLGDSPDALVLSAEPLLDREVLALGPDGFAPASRGASFLGAEPAPATARDLPPAADQPTPAKRPATPEPGAQPGEAGRLSPASAKGAASLVAPASPGSPGWPGSPGSTASAGESPGSTSSTLSANPARTPTPRHPGDAQFLTPGPRVLRPRSNSVGLPATARSPGADTPASGLRPRDLDGKSGARRRSFGDAVRDVAPSPSGLTPPARVDADTLLANFKRILASQQSDPEMRRQLLEQVQSAVRGKSMSGALLQQLCAAVLASPMPRDSQRYFLSAAFDACRKVLAVDDVVALREAISGQGWETTASLQVLANLYLAGEGCLTRESARTEWAAAKAAHPQDTFLVRQWVGQALERVARRSDLS